MKTEELEQLTDAGFKLLTRVLSPHEQDIATIQALAFLAIAQELRAIRELLDKSNINIEVHSR